LVNRISEFKTFTKLHNMVGLKRYLLKKFSIKAQLSLSLKLLREKYVEDSLSGIGMEITLDT
jgi:hypothetical protein